MLKFIILCVGQSPTRGKREWSMYFCIFDMYLHIPFVSEGGIPEAVEIWSTPRHWYV